MKILAIVGSLRKESYNKQLALHAKKIIDEKNNVEFEILDYTDVPFFNADIEFPEPESVKNVRSKVREADGIWIFTPEYNHSTSGVLKNLLDWLSRNTPEGERLLQGKPLALSGISPGMSGAAMAIESLVSQLSFLDMRIMNLQRLVIPHAREQTDDDGKLVLTNSQRYLEKQVDNFINFIAD